MNVYAKYLGFLSLICNFEGTIKVPRYLLKASSGMFGAIAKRLRETSTEELAEQVLLFSSIAQW